MPYAVQILPRMMRQINAWRLPDPVLVEVYLRLREDLAYFPALSLERLIAPFDGMAYRFDMVDPSDRLCRHLFVFSVRYAQDE